MRLDLSDLIAGKARARDLIERRVLEVSQKTTLDVHRAVVVASPVDTGAFRGAWTVEVPARPYDEGRIENATPYGPALVEGHSRQAPTGWLDTAVKGAVL